MNISQQSSGNLTTTVTIDVQPEDYKHPVEETLKKYQRTAQVKGFRPGKVPASMIKGMYGKSILVEELNKLLADSLEKYVTENKINMLGNPLPLPSENEQMFEEGQSFKFRYELGLVPEFDFNLSEKDVLPYYLIEVDQKMIEDDIADLRRRYGKFSNPEVSAEDNILYGDFEELDETGNPKVDGNKTTTTLSLEMIKDATEKQRFVGLKKDDQVTFHPMKVIGNEAEVAAMLKTEKNAPAMNSDYKLTIRTINKLDKAELNQEFFDKALGEGIVKSEEEFREKIREKIAKYFEYESDRKLKKDLKNYILDTVSIPLPEDFLKKMILNSVEQKKEGMDIDHEFYHLSEDLRWDLVKGKVMRENDFVVTPEEIQALAAQVVRSQFARYGIYDVADMRMEELVDGYLKKDDNIRQLERALYEDKVFTTLKTKVHLNMIPLPYEDFMSKMLEKTEHETAHHHHEHE